MKLVKNASGKTTVKMSRKEWTDLGKKAGWLKQAKEGIPCPKCDCGDTSIDNDGNGKCCCGYEWDSIC